MTCIDQGFQCDGVRPKCNTCQSKNLTCVYDVAEDGKTTTQLRAHVRRLAKELDDMKSIVSLLAMAPDRAQAANWASELEKNGFQHHSVEEIKKSLQVSDAPLVVWVSLTEGRTLRHHNPLYRTKTLSALRAVTNFRATDMDLNLHPTMTRRAKKGEVSRWRNDASETDAALQPGTQSNCTKFPAWQCS